MTTIGDIPVGGRFMFEGMTWQKADDIKIVPVKHLCHYPARLEVEWLDATQLVNGHRATLEEK